MVEIDYMKLPNLRQLQNFTWDLNYSGMTAEGWDDPVNIVPLFILPFSLVTVGFLAVSSHSGSR